MASDSADAGVEKVSPHSAELVEQVAAGDVVRIPKTLRLQALRTTADRNAGEWIYRCILRAWTIFQKPSSAQTNYIKTQQCYKPQEGSWGEA